MQDIRLSLPSAAVFLLLLCNEPEVLGPPDSCNSLLAVATGSLG